MVFALGGAFSAVAFGGSAQAATTTATVKVTGGTLAFCSVSATVDFPSVTLTGNPVSVTADTALDVCDQTGLKAGWNISATSTTFNDGTAAFSSTTAMTVQSAPSVACDAGYSCTVGVNDVAYPYTLPAASSAPTPTKLFDAAANSGMLNQTISVPWTLTVPADTATGTYTSTWTFSLATGP